MVDVVVNNVMATSSTPDFSKYFFKDPVGFLSRFFFPRLCYSRSPFIIRIA